MVCRNAFEGTALARCVNRYDQQSTRAMFKVKRAAGVLQKSLPLHMGQEENSKQVQTTTDAAGHSCGGQLRLWASNSNLICQALAFLAAKIFKQLQ